MSTITSTSTSHIRRHSLLRSIVLGGLIIGIADAIIYHWFVSSVLGGYPLISVFQFIASGVLGESAFAGGIATALLGVLFHYTISIVIAGVFIWFIGVLITSGDALSAIAYLPVKVILLENLIKLIPIIVATLSGAWIYKEKPI